MLRLADVVRRHGPAYLARHQGAILPSHCRAMTAITNCRTPALGAHLGVCARCEHRHLLYHSCRHRACARCGFDATERWLEHQRDLLLPVAYYHVVFTLPSELRRLVRQHQRALIDVLFRSAYAALAQLAADQRYLGGQIGVLAVLHTWTRALVYHPHVHMIVPGGALAADGTWHPVPRRRRRFLVPVKPLARLFAGKFLAAARQVLPGVTIPSLRAGTRWVVYAKPVVHGNDAILRYLGRYVHRTAITDGALIACTDHAVTFRYRDHRDRRTKQMTLPPNEFLRRFLQHVLPRGLHRVRTYGLLHSGNRHLLRRLQLLLTPNGEPEPRRSGRALRTLRCPRCRHGSLVLTDRLSREQCLTQLLANTAPTARAPPRQPSHPSTPHVAS